MVATFDAQTPLTPAGNPLNVAPVAVVVAYVIFVIAVLIHFVCVSVPAADERVAVFVAVTTTATALLVAFPHALPEADTTQ
jgi:hypothetical protein